MAQTQAKTMTQPVKLITASESNEITDQFKLSEAKFAQLADSQEFASLKDGLVEIDISAVLENLDADSYFEVTLPITGMTDFLAQEGLTGQMPQQFPTVMAINGFGAATGEGAFPKPYFIMVKDLVGNEYEVLVDEQGQIEVPEQGAGLFSILQSMTFIYSAAQIQEGTGFENIESSGAKSGMLYLLPPPGLEAGFTPKVAVSTLDDTLQRQVELEMKVPIEAFLPEPNLNMSTKVESASDKMNLFHLELQGELPLKKPLKLQLSLETGDDHTFEIGDGSTGLWQQVAPGNFEVPLALSPFAKFAVVRELLSEFDFTKSLLQGEDWGIAKTNGFNDFGLRPDGIGPYYDLMVDAVVQGKAGAEFLLAHVPESHFEQADFSAISFGQEDSALIGELMTAFSEHDLAAVTKALDPTTSFDAQLTLLANGELDSLPTVHTSYLDYDQPDVGWSPLDSSDYFLPDVDLLAAADSPFILSADASDIFAGDFDQAVSLSDNHNPLTIHYTDVMDFSDQGDIIEGFDLQHDQIDLSGLLDTMPGVSESDVVIQSHGQDVHVGIQGAGDEVMPIATLVGAAGPDLPDDLSHIIANPDMS